MLRAEVTPEETYLKPELGSVRLVPVNGPLLDLSLMLLSSPEGALISYKEGMER